MAKVYNSKSNAVRAFRTAYPAVAANLDNAQIRDNYLDEDDGGYVLIDPALVQANDDEEQARADAEYAERQAKEQARKDEVARQEVEYETGKTARVVAVGPASGPRANEAPKRPGSGVKIEANREQRNGVKRPSAGGVCREVWDECDTLLAAGTQPTVKALKELAPSRGWNSNNAAIEFYQWRKFNGITGRAK